MKCFLTTFDNEIQVTYRGLVWCAMSRLKQADGCLARRHREMEGEFWEPSTRAFTHPFGWEEVALPVQVAPWCLVPLILGGVRGRVVLIVGKGGRVHHVLNCLLFVFTFPKLKKNSNLWILGIGLWIRCSRSWRPSLQELPATRVANTCQRPTCISLVPHSCSHACIVKLLYR